MPETMTKTTATSIIPVTWEDLLNFGHEYEFFSNLLSDRLEDRLQLPEEAELFVYDYGFVAVVDTGCVEVEVEYEIATYLDEVEEETYSLTPKGKLTAALISDLNISYEKATAIASKVFPNDGEVVGS